MITIEVNDFCAGCGVCSIVCPKHSIKMTTNDLGFYMPEIRKELCVECGLFAKKWPSLRETMSYDIVLHASHAKNERLLRNLIVVPLPTGVIGFSKTNRD